MKSELLVNILSLMVLSGVIPVITLLLQFFLVGLNMFHDHYNKCEAYFPNVAIIVPAWNEEKVIGNTIDMLLSMDYPLSALRIYIVDDGSSDSTPTILSNKQIQYPHNVVNVRRENGGQGKAYTLNYGLDFILKDSWAEAVLIIDADVSFQKDALRKMTRHLADPAIGAVTAYIKEGTLQRNIITDFIAYEYINAQAGARRAQNVLGVQACLAGGAQLHSRRNIEAIGRKIDTSTLAEDTYTTFKTQIMHHRVIFDGNAQVQAEEPDTIVELWIQRFRWARGNIQLTKAFSKIWFRHGESGLGGIFFGLIWFSLALMPLVMIIVSIGSVALFFIDKELSWLIFRFLAPLSAITYLFCTLYTFFIDPITARRVWFAGLMFPGLISLTILAISFAPNFFVPLFKSILPTQGFCCWHDAFILFMDLWISLCMLFAWLLYRMDMAGFPRKITNFLLIFVGYGALLCAITFCAYIAQIRNIKISWVKTVKIGKKMHTISKIEKAPIFSEDLAKDIRHERKLFLYELLVMMIVIGILLLRHYYEF